MVEKHEIFKIGIQDQYRVLFPTPFEEEYPDGEYTLKEKYDTSVLHPFFCAVKGGTEDIKIQLDLSLKDEEHRITVNSDGIKVTYGTEQALYRAITSVRQLIVYGEGKKVPFANIFDKPSFNYRGYEVCRTLNRMSLKWLKRLADYLSELRYNAIELFIENGPEGFVYEQFPEVEPHPDDLTPEEMREFDRYCTERHIMLMLDTNCFGHLGRWFDIDKYRHLEIRDETVDTSASDGTLLDVNTVGARTGSLNILHPEARNFVVKLFDSYIPTSSAELVSVGLDEAFGLGKFQLKDICDEKGKEQVMLDYTHEIVDLVRERYGKRSFICTDMYRDLSPEDRAKFYRMLPKDAITREWGFETMNIHIIDELCRTKYENGVDYVSVTYSGTRGAFTGRFNAAVNNMRSSAEIAQKYGAFGYVVAIWNAEAYAWELVPAAVGAQYAWNVGHKQHGGWTKEYYVRNAQAYVDKYVFGGVKASREICNLANAYQLEPEYSACGTILHLMTNHPLSQKIKTNFYDIREVYDEFHIDNIIEYVNKCVKRIEAIDFPKLYKDEILNDAKALILAAELMRVRITDKVTRAKAEEMHKMHDVIVSFFKEFKREQGYTDTHHFLEPRFAARMKELDEYIVD